MPNIATLNVKLVAGIGGFASGMAAAAKPLAHFAGSVGAASAKIGGLVSAVAGLVGAGSLTALVVNSMEAIDANAKLADRLGFTTEQLTGLQHAANLAGVSSETLSGGMEKMLKNISEAAAGGGPASDALRQVGLDAKTLANETPDAALKQIADGLSKIDNPAQRASLAMDIFGKSGQSLLPLLTSGAEGIAAAQKEAEKLGLTFNRVDAAKVEAANDSMTRMKAVVEGVGNQLAVQFAPFIDAAAVKLTELATSGDGMGARVVAAFEAVVKGIAYASDYLSLARAGFKLLQAGGTAAVLGLVWVIDKLGHGIAWVAEKLGKKVDTTFLDQLTVGLEQDVKRLAAEAGQSFDSFKRGDNANAVGKFFDDIRAKSQAAAQAAVAAAPKMNGAFKQLDPDNLKKIGDTLADLQKQFDQFGLTESQKKLADFKGLGASPEQIAQADDMLQRLEALKNLTQIKTDNPLADFQTQMDGFLDLFNAGKLSLEQLQRLGDNAKDTLNSRLMEQADNIVESVKTPLEKYQDELDKLNGLLDRGLITQDTFDRAKLKAAATLEQASAAEPVAPKLLKAGSADAQRFAFDQTRGVQRLTKDDIQKKQLSEQELASSLLDRIERNTRNTATAPDVVEI